VVDFAKWAEHERVRLV